MTACPCKISTWLPVRRIVLSLAVSAAMISAAYAQSPSLQQLLTAVVGVKTFINPDARTTENLGRERSGSGIVIDDNGLVLTIGYLMVEAHAAEVTTSEGRTVPASIVGYDHETGFGLLRTLVPIKARPMAFGTSAAIKKADPVLVASTGGAAMMVPAHVVAVREFAGSWEYLLDRAIFTAPVHLAWNGAALINREGKLVGVGSLILKDAAADGEGVAGNMFVPIDGLSGILRELVSAGRAPGPGRPWLGVNTEPVDGKLAVQRVTQGGPAEKAGLRSGDIIVGVAGESTDSLADFYRKVWALGAAGTTVPLDVLRNNEKRRVEVHSMNRLDHLKLKSTY